MFMITETRKLAEEFDTTQYVYIFFVKVDKRQCKIRFISFISNFSLTLLMAENLSFD